MKKILFLLSINLVFGQTWTKTFVDVASVSQRPVICSDSLGHLHVAWTSDMANSGDLQYASNQYGDWGFTQQVEGFSSDAYVPVITSDKYGFAYIVGRFSVSNIRYATNKDKTTSTWTAISPNMGPGHFHEVSIEVDSDRDVHIFAEGDHNGYGTVYYQDDVQANEVISGGVSAYYGTAIDQNDILHFVGNPDGQAGLWYANHNGSWSTAVAINDTVSNAGHSSIACDFSGNLHVAFINWVNYKIYYTNNIGGSWLTPIETNGAGIWPDIVIDENGKAHILYWTSGNPGYLYYMNNMSGTWMTPSNVATINESSSIYRVDVSHVEKNIALDHKNSTVNIVYIENGDSVIVAQSSDYKLRNLPSLDMSTTLVNNDGTVNTDTVSTDATGEKTLLQFTINDIGGDGQPTKIQEMVIQRGLASSSSKYFTDFFQSMTMEVSDATSLPCSLYAHKAVVGTANTVWKNVPEGGSLTFTLKGTLQSSLSSLADETVQLKINGLHDVIIDPSGSYFTTSNNDVVSDTILFTLQGLTGSGTQLDPYLISNLDELKFLSENSAYWDKYIRQTANINASATSTWNSGAGFSPLGNLTMGFFTGSYDGSNHVIDSLTINRTGTNYIGLFGYSSGSISNIGLTNATISGADYVGGIVGFSSGTISNSYSTGTITGGNFVAGLAAFLSSGSINNCFSTMNVNATGMRNGGLVGYLFGSSISNSYATGDVTRTSGVFTDFGAFCGYVYNSSINYCYSIGNVNTGFTDKGFVGTELGANTYDSNFWDSEASNQSTAIGATAKTTAEMKAVETFTDLSTNGLTTPWDFVTNPNDDTANNDYWDIDKTVTPTKIRSLGKPLDINNNYPFLDYQNGSDVSLPVELASFTLKNNIDGVLCEWITESEIDNLGFILERRDDNSDWVVIASYKSDDGLIGYGTTSSANIYQYLDRFVKANTRYKYRLADIDYDGNITYQRTQTIKVEKAPLSSVIDKFTVMPAYPNPFNPTTKIVYGLSKNSDVRIEIYNIVGELINTINDVNQNSGWHSVEWNGTDVRGNKVPAGIYICRVNSNRNVKTIKLMLLK